MSKKDKEKGKDKNKQAKLRVSPEDHCAMQMEEKKVRKAQRAYHKWLRGAAREAGFYADQVEAVLVGKVVDDEGNVQRADDGSRMMKECEGKNDALQDAVDQFNDFMANLARR